MMSFTYYCAVGMLISIVSANLATFIFGRNDVSAKNRNLFAPCVRRFIKPNQYDCVDQPEKSVLMFDLKNDLTESCMQLKA